MATRDIIVIGGSTGSGAVLRSLFSRLPGDLPASLFVVTHVPSNSIGYLAEALDGIGPLPVSEAIDGQPIERGRAYVAVPDRHLLLADGTIMLGEGPRENMVRPAIDPLFRSAAFHYGGRAVGVVLTGMLNDGAAGLSAIKQCGGTTIVQHPLDAEADQMPAAALEAVEVDHVAPVADLPGLIAAIASSQARESRSASESIELEVDIAMGARLGAARLSRVARPSAISCPDCHGVLSEMHAQGPLRFRCQIGHAYTAEMLAARSDELDEAVRIALRVMEERVTLTSRMADDARNTGRNAVAELYEARAEEYSGYAGTLRKAAIRSLRTGRARRPQAI
jgi:two-component system chemotaxis response regulator CheB